MIPIGRDSQNELITLDFQETKNIFGSFFNQNQFEVFLLKFFELNKEHELSNFYVSGRKETISIVQDKFKDLTLLTHYYDRPSRSSFLKKNDFLKPIIDRYSKVKNKKSPNDNVKYICIIENIWEFIRLENRLTINKLFELIENGPTKNIHFIVSSSLPLNNLYNQIFMYLHKGQLADFQQYFSNGILVSNPLGTEIIFNSDDLIFYKVHSSANYKRLYGF